MSITRSIIQVSSVFALLLSTGLSQDIYQGDISHLSAALHRSLVYLGRNATKPQPKFGLGKPIEPLPAVAPLRYLHDGDLLKLRLLLNNVTLEGLSSLTVQEVTFRHPGEITPPGRATTHSSSSTATKPDSESTFEPSSNDFTSEGKEVKAINNEREVEYEYYYDDSDDDDDYVIRATLENDDEYYDETYDSIPQVTNDDEDYQADDAGSDRRKLRHRGEDDLSRYEGSGEYKNFESYCVRKHKNRKNDRKRDKKRRSSRKKKTGHKKRGGAKPKRHENKKYRYPSRKLENLESFEEQFLKDYDELVKRSRRIRNKRSAMHHDDKLETPRSRHAKRMRLEWYHKQEEKEGITGSDASEPVKKQENYYKPPEALESKIHHHHSSISTTESDQNTMTSPTTVTSDTNKRPSSRFLTLRANVRVAFTNIQIKAQYIVRGKAGGVFTFKEQGRLVLTIPNAFLTSTFNVTLIPDLNGLRHWKNSRRNHVRVQKIRSRLSLDTPSLQLIPVSRPTEWVRRQLQEKMDELGKGVGRRDGAIRLLLRHWARLLRRLVIKAAKQQPV